MKRQPIAADRALEIRLTGTSTRLVREGASTSVAVAMLRDMADGRADLLAAAWLVLAGADAGLAVDHADVVRDRVSRTMHSTPKSPADEPRG